MDTTEQRAEAARLEGYAAGMATPPAPLSANPYSRAQGSPTRVEAIGWRKGWTQAEADLDAQNEDRQFREPKA